MYYFVIVDESRQDRTPSGRWSAREYAKKRFCWTESEFENATSEDTRRFFGARISRTYTQAGYIPYRWTSVVGWEGDTRQIQLYTPVVIPYEAMGARESWIFNHAASIELNEAGGHRLAVITAEPDIEGHADACVYDLDNRVFVG